MANVLRLAGLALTGAAFLAGCGTAERPAGTLGSAAPASTAAGSSHEQDALAVVEAQEPEAGTRLADNIGAGLRAGGIEVKAPIALPPAPSAADTPAATAKQGVGGGSGGARVMGIDVSMYQGTINWAAVKASGRDFAIARVADGYYVDPTFQRNWSEMKAHGIVRGVYQFFEPAESAVGQADVLLARIPGFGKGDIPPVLDCEVSNGVSAGFMHSQIATWCAHIQARLGVRPIVYTSPGFWNGHGQSAVAADLWVANWFVSAPGIPRGWGNWVFWQYNDNSSIPGIGGRVDGDEFHGTLADLQAFVGGTHTPPPGGTSGGGRPNTYTVQPGDSLSGIAARFGVTLAALEAANPQIHNPNLIYVGQVINLPGHPAPAPAPKPAPKPAPAPAPHHRTYTVHSGDSMSGIAARFGVSLAALERANPQIHNPNLIYPGQVINIP